MGHDTRRMTTVYEYGVRVGNGQARKFKIFTYLNAHASRLDSLIVERPTMQSHSKIPLRTWVTLTEMDEQHEAPM